MITAIHGAKPCHSLRWLCRVFGVNRSWYRQTHHSVHVADTQLRDAIEAIILDFPGYGYRRVTHTLQRNGWQVNHKRVLRIMREEALLCQLKRHFTGTTSSQHGGPRYRNRVRDTVIDRLNQVWVADITYIRLPTTFVYLACVLDAYSRRCVGWQLSRTIDHHLTLAAITHAVTTRQPAVGWIHHSDQGVQYAASGYVDYLHAHGAQISMAARGNPYENAQAERFFKTLKYEEVYLKEYQTFADAECQLGQFIDDVYNTKRLHSRLGYRTPTEFETWWAEGHTVP